MRLIGYVRVSTDRQAEEGFGLYVQRQALKKWARREGHRLVGILEDAGVSGTAPPSERPGLADALATIADGKADGLAVPRLDRLARRLDVQEAALATVWRSEGRVFTVDGGEVLCDDPDDPLRTFVRQVLGAVGQFDRAQIVARLRHGRRAKAERGGYAYGAPPFGYRAADGALVAHEAEQATLARARELRAAGASLRAIAATLDAEGRRPRRAAKWSPQALADVLAREPKPARRAPKVAA